MDGVASKKPGRQLQSVMRALPDDAVLAFEGHATHELLSGSDLYQPRVHGSQAPRAGVCPSPQYRTTPTTTMSGSPAEVTSAFKLPSCSKDAVAASALSLATSVVTDKSRLDCRSRLLVEVTDWIRTAGTPRLRK